MDKDIPTFNIDLDKKCSRCGKGGVFGESGLCMPCAVDGVARGDYDELLKNIKPNIRGE